MASDDDWLTGGNELDDSLLVSEPAGRGESKTARAAGTSRQSPSASPRRDAANALRQRMTHGRAKDGQGNDGDGTPTTTARQGVVGLGRQSDDATEQKPDDTTGHEDRGPRDSAPTTEAGGGHDDGPTIVDMDDPWGDADDSVEPDASSVPVEEARHDAALSAQSGSAMPRQAPTQTVPAEPMREPARLDMEDAWGDWETGEGENPAEAMRQDDSAPAPQSDNATSQQHDRASVGQSDKRDPREDRDEGGGHTSKEDDWDSDWDWDEAPAPAQQSNAETAEEEPMGDSATGAGERPSQPGGSAGRQDDDGWWDWDNSPTGAQRSSTTGSQSDSATAQAPARQATMEPRRDDDGEYSGDGWDDWGEDYTTAQQSPITPTSRYPNPPAPRGDDAPQKQEDSTTEAEEETENDGHRPILRLIAIIAAIIAATALLITGGAYAYNRYTTHQQTQQQQEEQQRRQDKLTRLQHRWDADCADAKTLIDDIAKHGMTDSGNLKKLTGELKALSESRPITASQLEQASTRLERKQREARREYDAQLDRKANDTDGQLKQLIAQADSLGDAPDTDDRKRMRQTADQWRDAKVDTSNMEDAAKAADLLRGLVATVTRERDEQKAKDEAEKARQQAERQQQEQQQTTPDYGYDYNTTPRYGTGGGAQPTPQQTAPQPAAPSQPQKQPGSSGQTLG